MRFLKITKEIANRVGEERAHRCLGIVHENVGDFEKAIDYYQCSVTTYNDVRAKFHFNHEWKIGIRDRYDIDIVYSRLWLLFLKQGKVMEALVSAEQGRAMSL